MRYPLKPFNLKEIAMRFIILVKATEDSEKGTMPSEHLFAEMGAFHDLGQPQRETNLLVRLDEYLRFGLDAGIFYAS